MDEQLLQILYQSSSLNSNISFDEFKKGMSNPELQRIAYESSTLKDSMTFEAMMKDLKPVEKGYLDRVTDYFGEAGTYVKERLVDAVNSGYMAGDVDILSSPDKFKKLEDEKIKKLSQYFKDESTVNEVGGDNGAFIEALEWVGDLGLSVATSLTSSVTDIVEDGSGLAVIGSAMAVGTGVGAVSGGGVGAIPGGISGMGYGITAAMIGSGANIQATSVFKDRVSEYAQEKGLDPSKPEDLKLIFSDDAFMKTALGDATTSGAIVGSIDTVTAGLGSKTGITGAIASTLRKKGLSRYAANKIGEMTLEGAGGGFGELGSQLAIEDKLDPEAILQEVLAESIGGTVEIAGVKLSQEVINRNKYRLMDTMIDAAQNGDRDGFIKGVESKVTEGELTPEVGKKLIDRYDNISSQLSQLPVDLIENKIDRREAFTLFETMTDIDAKIEETKNWSDALDIKQKTIDKLEKTKKVAEEKLNELVQPSKLKPPVTSNSSQTTTNQQPTAGQQTTTTQQPTTTVEEPFTSPEDNRLIDILLQDEIRPIENVQTGEGGDDDSQGKVGNSQSGNIDNLQSNVENVQSGEGGDDEAQPKPAEKPPVTKTDKELVSEILSKEKNNEPLDPHEKNLLSTLTEFDRETDRTKLEGKEVIYEGKKGKITIDKNGVYHDDNLIESALNPEVTNVELGISEVEQEPISNIDEISTPTTAIDNSLKIGDTVREFGSNFVIDSFVHDSEGNPTQIKVRNEKGESRILNSKALLSRVPVKTNEANISGAVEKPSTPANPSTNTTEKTSNVTSKVKRISKSLKIDEKTGQQVHDIAVKAKDYEDFKKQVHDLLGKDKVNESKKTKLESLYNEVRKPTKKNPTLLAQIHEVLGIGINESEITQVDDNGVECKGKSCKPRYRGITYKSMEELIELYANPEEESRAQTLYNDFIQSNPNGTINDFKNWMDERKSYTPLEEVEYGILETREEISKLEQELSEAAIEINNRLNAGEFGDKTNDFTTPFDEGRITEGKNPIQRKGNVAALADALSTGRLPKQVQENLDKDILQDLKTKIKKWKELAKTQTPTVLREQRAKAVAAVKEAQINKAYEREYPGITKNKGVINAQIKKIGSVMPSVKIILFDSPKEFAAKVKELTGNTSGKDFGGMYDPKTDVIYLNPHTATETTLPHEISHAIFKKLFKAKSKDALMIHQSIKKVLENGSPTERQLADDLAKFIANYETAQHPEEFFAELVGWLVANKTKITKPRIKAIKQRINQIIKNFTGLTLFDENEVDLGEVVDFVNNIAKGIDNGTNIKKILGYMPTLQTDGIVFQKIGTRLFQSAENEFRINETESFNEPLESVVETIEKYKNDKGLENFDSGLITELNKNENIEKLYKEAETTPLAELAYEMFSKEVQEQYSYLVKEGIKVELTDTPYVNASQMLTDVRDNKVLKIVSSTTVDPLMQDSKFKDVNGKTLSINDIFQATHNYFGYLGKGGEFNELGKANARDSHIRMFSPLAARAMFTETLGLSERKMVLLPEALTQSEDVSVRFQKPVTTKTRRDGMLNQLKSNINEFKSTHNPMELYSKFKSMFDERGVTLYDIAQIYEGLDPNRSVNEYAIAAKQRLDKFNAVLDKIGFTQEQKEATVAIWSEHAEKWADLTGRTSDEFWTAIVEDFEYSLDGSELRTDGNVAFQAEVVKKSLWEKLKSFLPFSKSKNYTENSETTPLQEDRDLESDAQGLDFLTRNREVIRGARKITDNHRAIIYLTSAANISTPVHELAHVYEMYMPNEDKQTFLKEMHRGVWDTNTSEMFAIGFERFLADGRATDNPKLQKVFDNFKNWLRDIYEGLFKWGNREVYLNEKTNELYSKMFNSPILNLDKFEKESEHLVKAIDSDGVKYNHKTMEEMADVLGFNLEHPYIRQKQSEIAARALSSGLVDLKLGLQTAMEMIEKDRLNPGSESMSPQQQMAFVYLAGKLQKQAIQIRGMLNDNPDDLNIRNDLHKTENSIAIILTALSLGRSLSGSVLGAGAKKIIQDWHTPEAITARIKAYNQNVSEQRLTEVVGLAKEVQEIETKLNEKRETMLAEEKENMIRDIDKNIRAIFNIPVFKGILEQLQQDTRPLAEIEVELFDKLKKFYDSTLSFQSNLFGQQDKGALIPLIAVILKKNTEINTIRELTDYINKKRPEIKTTDVIEVFNLGKSVTTKTTTKTISKLKEQVQNIQKEADLVQKLKDLITLEAPVPEEQRRNTTQPQRLIRAAIDELKALALQDSTAHNYSLLYKYLDDIVNLYNTREFGEISETIINGKKVKFNKEDINNLLLKKLNDFTSTRFVKLDGRKQSIKEKIEDIDSLIEDIVKMGEGKTTKRDYYAILERINEKNAAPIDHIDPAHHSRASLSDYYHLKAELSSKKKALNEMAADLSEKFINRTIKELISTPRLLKLAFDYGYMTYHMGWYTFRNLLSKDGIWQLNLIKDTVLGSLSESYAQKIQDRREMEYGSTKAYMEELGLQIPNIGSADSMNEIIQTKSILERMNTKITKAFRLRDVNVFRGLRNFNDRGFAIYVGEMRMREFTRLEKRFADPEIKREIAERINTFTGASRKFSNTKETNDAINQGLTVSSNILIAPRMYVSVFKSLCNLTMIPSIYKAIANKNNPELVRYYKTEMLDNLHILMAYGVSQLLIASIANALDKDDDDSIMDALMPFSTSFGKIQVGEDLLQLSPYSTFVRAAIRLFTKWNIERQGGEFNTQGLDDPQTYSQALWDEFFKYRLSPSFSSYDLLVNHQDFRDKKIEYDNFTEKVIKIYLPALAPISLEGLARDVYEEKSLLKTGFHLAWGMAGLNSYTPGAADTPKFRKYMGEIKFKYRTEYPDFIKKEDKYNRAIFKTRCKNAFDNEVGKLIKEGKKPSKAALERTKDRVHRQIENEMKGQN